MQPKSMAILQANDIMPTNADGTMGFRQSSDLFYLSGVDQEETVLLIFPQHPDPKFREVLFVRETNEHIAVWEGEKLTKEQAREVSGIPTIYWTHQYEAMMRLIVFEANSVYLNTNEHTRNESPVQTRDGRFIREFRERYPLHTLDRLAPLMHALRAIKQPQEIELLQTACDITEQAFERLLKFVKPGVMEYEIEAELLHEFVRNRSRGFAYTPIIASGANACVLHYIQNNQACQDGDVILLGCRGRVRQLRSRFDPFHSREWPLHPAPARGIRRRAAGVQVRQKSADRGQCLGRVPRGGRYLYGKGTGGLRVYITPEDIKNQDPDWPAYKKYFPHGTSHFLGLDVHDVGNKYRRFEPGMVFTCEPGIYIPEEGLGIRLENDILITAEGNRDLMAHIPIEAEEIEDLMNSRY